MSKRHESEALKAIKAYFMRRGTPAEAHAFELKMEHDAFLFAAVQGFEGMMSSDVQQCMDEFELELQYVKTPLNVRLLAAAILAFTLALAAWWWFHNEETKPEKNYQPANHSMPGTSWYELPKPQTETATLEEVIEASTGAVPSAPSLPAAVKPIAKNESTAKSTGAVAKSIEQNAEPQPPAPQEKPKEQPGKGTAAETSPSPKSSPFDTYVKTNLKRTAGMPTGRVKVSYESDRNGKPRRISVDQSLCTACDAEAIRLVEQATYLPAASKNQRASVWIEF